MDHVGLKTRSVGQLIEKPCEHPRGHSFGPIFIKLCQDGIWIMLVSKTRSVGQIIEKPFEHSRSHSFGSIFIEIGQDRIWIIPSQKIRSVGQITEKPCEHSIGHSFGLIFITLAIEYGSCWVKNRVSKSDCFNTMFTLLRP